MDLHYCMPKSLPVHAKTRKKGNSIFHKVKSNFHMTVLCSEICSCLLFDYKDYPFLILIAFLFWNNYRFTEKFQRWYRKFLHIYHSISPIVITLHHPRTFVKNWKTDMICYWLWGSEHLYFTSVSINFFFLFQDPVQVTIFALVVIHTLFELVAMVNMI